MTKKVIRSASREKILTLHRNNYVYAIGYKLTDKGIITYELKTFNKSWVFRTEKELFDFAMNHEFIV